MPGSAVIAGLGPGFCERFAWQLADAGYGIGLFARSQSYVETVEADLLAAGHDAHAVPVDLTDPDALGDAIASVREALGPIDVLAHTASTATGSDEALDPDRFEAMWRLYAESALHCARAVLPDMRDAGGTILFFGAAPEMGDFAYASAKDAARGLARSLASTYGPEGVHVAHVVIAGPILNPDVYDRLDPEDVDEADFMDPDAVAETCLSVIEQDERAWTFELDLRPLGRTNIR